MKAGEASHWYAQDTKYSKLTSWYTALAQTRKWQDKWCNGKKDTPHDYQPFDKFNWVKNGLAVYTTELPWILHFAKCSRCGSEKIWHTKRKGYSARLRAKQWKQTKLDNGIQEDEQGNIYIMEEEETITEL